MPPALGFNSQFRIQRRRQGCLDALRCLVCCQTVARSASNACSHRSARPRAARWPASLREDAPGEQYCKRAGAAGTVKACLQLACHPYRRMRPSLPRSGASARCASCSRWSAATRPRNARGRPKHKDCRWCYSRARSLLQELLPAIDIYDAARG